jgi:hypothetical protein
MRPDHQEWIATSPLDMGPELGLEIRWHHVAVERMRQQVVEWDHPWTNPGAGHA